MQCMADRSLYWQIVLTVLLWFLVCSNQIQKEAKLLEMEVLQRELLFQATDQAPLVNPDWYRAPKGFNLGLNLNHRLSLVLPPLKVLVMTLFEALSSSQSGNNSMVL